jgi:hypothetical protein
MKDLKEGLREGEEKMKQLADQELMHRNACDQIKVEMLQLKGRLDLLRELIQRKTPACGDPSCKVTEENAEKLIEEEENGGNT